MVNIFKDRQCKELVCRSSWGHFCRIALEPACTHSGWTAWGQGYTLFASWWRTLSHMSYGLTLLCGSGWWGHACMSAGVCWCRFAWGHSCSVVLACGELLWSPGPRSFGLVPGSAELLAGVLSSFVHGSTHEHRWWSTRSRRWKSTQAWLIVHKLPANLWCRSLQAPVSPQHGTPHHRWSLPAASTGTRRWCCIHFGNFLGIQFCKQWNNLHHHHFHHFHRLHHLLPCRSSSDHRKQRQRGRNKRKMTRLACWSD